MGKESLQWPSSEWVCVSVHVEERVEKVRQVYRECVFVAQGEMQEQVGGPTLWEERKSSECGQCVCVRLRDAVWLKSLCLSIIRFSAADATLAHLRTRALPWHTHTHTHGRSHGRTHTAAAFKRSPRYPFKGQQGDTGRVAEGRGRDNTWRSEVEWEQKAQHHGRVDYTGEIAGGCGTTALYYDRQVRAVVQHTHTSQKDCVHVWRLGSVQFKYADNTLYIKVQIV